jgi:hypothetical protein
MADIRALRKKDVGEIEEASLGILLRKAR